MTSSTPRYPSRPTDGGTRPRIGAFPGTFDPPTVAHLAAAEAAHHQRRLDRVDLIVSRAPLAKTAVMRPTLEERLAVLRSIASRIEWLEVVVSDLQLIADLADGYDVVIVGADKWHQIHDPIFYDDSTDARDAALARLPEVAVVPRADLEVPAHLAVDLDAHHRGVSSTAARLGHLDLMAPEAAAFARRHGVWGFAEAT